MAVIINKMAKKEIYYNSAEDAKACNKMPSKDGVPRTLPTAKLPNNDGIWKDAPILIGSTKFEPLPDVKNIMITGGAGFM